MKKYGEIGRVKLGDFTYILETSKETIFTGDDAVWFDIHITRKSAKRRHLSNKLENMYTKTQGGIKEFNEIAGIVKAYLKEIQPEFLIVSAYNDDYYYKRLRVYANFLSRNGYKFFSPDIDEYGVAWNGCNIYKRVD